MQGQVGDAERAARKLIELGPHDSINWATLARVLGYKEDGAEEA